MNIPMILATLVVFVALPLNWLVVALLLRLLRKQPYNRLLRDRFLVAAMLALVVTVFAGVFVNNDRLPPPLTLAQTQVLTRLSILTLVVPAIYWLTLYRRRDK